MVEYRTIAPREGYFSLEAENWRIPFSLIEVTGDNKRDEISIKRVKINTKFMDLKHTKVLEGTIDDLPIIHGRIDAPELVKWNFLFSLIGKIRQGELIQLFYLLKNERHICQPHTIMKGFNELIISTETLDIKENSVFDLEVIFNSSDGNQDFSFNTSVIVRNLPAYPRNKNWLAGNFHVHSTHSDGQRNLSEINSIMKERGYNFVYMADGHHTKRLLAEDWDQYKEEIWQASDQEISLFPGVETAVGPIDNEEGHLLVHGTNKSIAGLEEHTLSSQKMIDAAKNNEPTAPSSALIAHPCGLYPWKDFRVKGHNGMEIISGALQLFFGLNSSPSRLWRSEIVRLMKHTFSQKLHPAPHGGTDWHGYWFEPLRNYVTWVYLDAEWDHLSYHQKKSLVDKSLYYGNVVASRCGSLGFFTIDGKPVGSIIHDVKPCSTLPLSIEFYSVKKGIFSVYIYRNNMDETVFKKSLYLNIGQSKKWESKIYFPGGSQAYWLFVKGADYIYSSPIYLFEK